MSNSINSNIAAYSAEINITNASNAASASVSRLSSGNAIVNASDNVAGLAVGTSLATQVNLLKTAQSNASQGSSLLQVADGSLAQIQSILQQQQSLAQQAQSGSLTDTDRGFLDQQFQGLTTEINQIASSTNFNGVNLLAGGLGTSSSLVNTDALAAAFVPTTATGSTAGTAVASATAIEAFNNQTGATDKGTAAAGDLDITDSSGAVLSGAAYNNVNSAVYGQFSNFQISNVVYGTSATLSATLNGVTFSGSVATGATTALLSNGNTYINIGTSALTLTNAATVQVAQDQLGKDFANTVIQRTQQINGVDFSGTRLAGAVGVAATGISQARLNAPTANISNFAYAGNTGAANTSELTVQINGETFTATGVKDALATGTPKIVFQSQDAQSFTVDLTGLTTAFTNIRTDPTQQAGLINALNQGFSKAGSGLNFNVGSSANANINVSLSSSTSSSLYNGQTLSVATAAGATAAAATLTTALNTVTAQRATVGALESQFNFASASLQSSVQNQDAARGQYLDTDIASESTTYANEQVKAQAGITVLAQANASTQQLLKLLQG